MRLILEPEPVKAAMMRRAGRRVPTHMTAWGLIDTGATVSAVCRNISDAFAWHGVGAAVLFTPTTGPSDKIMVETSFRIEGHAARFAQEAAEVEHLGYEMAGLRVAMLLGMDFLARKELIVDGRSGSFTLRW